MFILDFIRVYRTLIAGLELEFNYYPYCRHIGFYRMDFIVLDGGLSTEYLMFMKHRVGP